MDTKPTVPGNNDPQNKGVFDIGFDGFDEPAPKQPIRERGFGPQPAPFDIAAAVKDLLEKDPDERKLDEVKTLLPVFNELKLFLEQKHDGNWGEIIKKIDDVLSAFGEKESIIGRSATVPIRILLTNFSERAKIIIDLNQRGADSTKAVEGFKYLIQCLNDLNNELKVFVDKQIHDLPFDKEFLSQVMDALKIPACPGRLLQDYLKQYKATGKIVTTDFKEKYKVGLTKEIKTEISDITDLIESQKSFYKTNNPDSKELKYWSSIKPEEMYKALLRWRTIELLSPSAGEKRLSPEFLEQVYDAWKKYEKERTSN